MMNNQSNRQPQYNSGQNFNSGIRAMTTGFCEVPIDENGWSSKRNNANGEYFENENWNGGECQQQEEIGNPKPYF